MGTKEEKANAKIARVEIQFMNLNPLELWGRLGLQQFPEPISMEDPEFDDDEEKRAYETFKRDLEGEMPSSQNLIISSDKGSVFIWSLLKEESRRSDQLSSINHLFRDDVFNCIDCKCKQMEIEFDEEDFDEIIRYLETMRLIQTSRDGIRITQHFHSLFHECYEGWLVF